MAHHDTQVERAPGVWQVARPLRAGWWTQRKRERRCRREIGHCWHPEGMIDWWCCACSAETEGMPPRECKICAVRPAVAGLV